MRALCLVVLAACYATFEPEPPEPTDIEIEMIVASLDDLKAQRALIGDAFREHPGDPGLVAQLAFVEGISSLIWGTRVPSEQVFQPVAPWERGFRAWARGKVAYELTRATTPEELVPLDALLAELAKLGDDPWRTYLEGRVALLRGDLVTAAARFEQANLPIAQLDRAMLVAGEGDYYRALYELGVHDFREVLHELLQIEGGQPRYIIHFQSKDLAPLRELEKRSPKVAAYVQLTRAQVGVRHHRYEETATALAKLDRASTLPNECWFWERVAMVRLALGNHQAASSARRRCTIGTATGTDHVLALVDAQLELGNGRPEVAQRIAATVPDGRGRVLEAEAELVMGHPERASRLLAHYEDGEFMGSHRALLSAQATAQLATGRVRARALVELSRIADDGAKARWGRFSAPVADDQCARRSLGAAYLAIGDRDAARRELRRVVEETDVDRPDPRAYRTHQLLAEIALANTELVVASSEIDAALRITPRNAGILALRATLEKLTRPKA